MPRYKTQAVDQDVGRYGLKYATLQVPPAVKRVLKIEQARRSDIFLGQLVAELVIERYGKDPEYRKILKEAGLIE